MGMTEVGFLAAVPYLAAVIGEITFATWSDLSRKRLALVWPCLLVAAAAFYGSYLLGATHFWASFVLLTVAGAMMYAPYGPFFAYIAEAVPRNVVGGAIALINSMGALGSFVGAYGVGMLNSMTGSPGASYLMMAAGLVVSAAITVGCCRRRRERLLLDLNRGQRAVHEDGDGAVAGFRLGAVIMHAIDQIGQHRTLGIGHGIVVRVIDIAGRDPPGAVDHHGIARMLVIMRMAEMAGMPFDQLHAGAGLVLGSPIGQAVSLASPFFHWIWSGVRAMAWVGSMVAWAKAGAQVPETWTPEAMLEHERLPIVWRGQ